MDIVEPTQTVNFDEKSQAVLTPSNAAGRGRALLELVITYALVLLALWTPNPVQRLVIWITSFWMVAITLLTKQNAAELGLRLAGLSRSLWVAGVALGLAMAAVLIASRAHTFHPVSYGVPLELSFMGYMVWSLIQQFVILNIFLFRLLRILPTRTSAVVVTGLLFAVAHIPNPLLTFATLIWGIVACAIFLRYRNVYSLGLAHGILGICLAITVPNTLHHQMRVGIGYLRWHAQAEPVHRSQSNQIVSTDAWVIADATSRRSSRHARP